MVALALLGVGISGGTQVGYASLVDRLGPRGLSFDPPDPSDGDLREPSPAKESIDALLSGFPAGQ